LSTTIRLTRMGKKKRPFYRLVVMDNRKRRDGAYLANLGYYNPFVEPHEVQLHTDDIIAWMQKGATPSETARALLRAEGILYRFSLVREGLDPAEIESRMSAWASGAEARQTRRKDAASEARRAAREARAKAEEEKLAAAQREAEAAESADAGEPAGAEDAAAAADGGADETTQQEG
jgi:small subunit ribosomal protein S16